MATATNCCCCVREHEHRGPRSEALAELSTTSPHNPGGMFKEFTFVNHQGLRLWAYSMMPEGPKKGVLVMQHGTAVHSIYQFLVPEQPGGAHVCLKGSLLERLLEAGFGFYMVDMQGHGLTDGSRGEQWFFERFEDLCLDFQLFVDLVRRREGNIENLFALGCSMGGGVVTKCSIARPDFVKGMILLCPMLSLEKLASSPAARIMRPFASIFSASCPTALVAPMRKNTMFPLVEKEKMDDKMNNNRTKQPARVAAECIAFSDFMTKQGGFKLVKTPFLACHAPDDTLVDVASSERLAAEASSTDRKFVPATGMWHALTQETGRERIFDEIVAWLLARI